MSAVRDPNVLVHIPCFIPCTFDPFTIMVNDLRGIVAVTAVVSSEDMLSRFKV